MVSRLIAELMGFPEIQQIILTINIPEVVNIQPSPKLIILENTNAFGFGKNHNRAFKLAEGKFFCVLNPDVVFPFNPFATLLSQFQIINIDLVVPMVIDSSGAIEDSMRYFPTPLSIFKKILWGEKSKYHFTEASPIFFPEWVAGMFMLFRAQKFFEVGGFDERFYLYYEDVDICARIWQLGGAIVGVPQVRIIHDAQRASRSNLQHLSWHISSMARYFFKYACHLPRVKHI